MNNCETLVRGVLNLSGADNAPILYQMLGLHGVAHVGKVNPSFTGRGLKQQCYRNAVNLCSFANDEGRYVYAEGYAMKPGLVPLPHAWVVDRQDDRAIDPTWSEQGIEYFGVQFDPDWVVEQSVRNGSYSIFENLHQYKIHPKQMVAMLQKHLAGY